MTTNTEAPANDIATDTAPSESPPGGRRGGLLVGIGLNEPTLQRIRDAGSFEVSDDSSQVLGATIIALSTRTDRGQVAKMPEDIDPEGTPIVVVCHPGGETQAVSLMQKGCVGVVAEGNEQALASFVDPDHHTDVLIAGFLEQQGGGSGRSGGGKYDPITNLPETASFETRLGEFTEAGTPINVVMLEITNLETARERTDSRAVNLLRRRLASFYSDAARRRSCEVFSLGDSTFAVVDGAQMLVNPEGLANELIEITEAFRPAGVKLQLAVGAVIGSAETDIKAIQDQAESAVLAAAQAGESSYVTVDEVTVLLASSTEYNVAQLLISLVDQQAPNPPGHSNRVADLASAIGEETGYQGRDLNNLRLAALLHDVGRIPPAQDAERDDESYADRGARYVLASAGPEVADAVRYHAERWDGAGPGALVEDDIPLEARIIAIAKAADTWLYPPAGEECVAPNELAAKLQAESGSRFDPTLVETASRLIAGI